MTDPFKANQELLDRDIRLKTENPGTGKIGSRTQGNDGGGASGKAEQKFKNLFDQAVQVIGILIQDGVFKYDGNPQFARIS